MKNHRLLILSLIIFNIFIVNAQDVFIYDKSGNKIYLYEQKNMYIIRIDEQYLSQIQTIDKKIEFVGGNFIKIELKNYNEKQTLLDKLKLPQNLSNIIFSKVFMATDSVIQWCTNQIVVQIMTGYDITLLLKEYNIPYSKITQFNSNKQTFLVDLYGIDDIAIKYANILYKSNKVVYAQPSFWRIIQPYSSFYRDQWGLNNTGQLGGIPGIDINAPEAWGLATGNGVKIAVVDEGIDLSHPDLFANLLTGYDATDGQYGGINGGCKGNDAHGTACAGIVAAINNDIGITGIAYNSNIIPIRIAYGNNGGWITYDTWIADGLNKAQEEFKADVISNSWGGGSNSEIINSAIQNAVTNGRNGKGCIVVFASGNYNGSIIYPANSNPDILTVGAISLCGERKSPLSCDGEMWGSNYGKQLDIVAPGVLIPTTDIQGSFGYNPNNHIHVNLGGNKVNSDYTNRDYTIWFSGTSSACPHVSGVAALVLSANPNLTGQEVRDIIEKTAQKVRPDLYSYNSDQSHSNGTWNNEMGYGLVDAYAAVRMAKGLVAPADLYVRDSVGDIGDEPSGFSRLWASPDIWIEDMAGNRVNPYGDDDYNVCVRIHNRSDNASLGNERLLLNWAKAGIDLNWSGSWTGEEFFICKGKKVPKGGYVGDINGVVIPSIPAHSNYVIKIKWHVPKPEDYKGCDTTLDKELWHFCLLARIHDGHPILHENESSISVRDLVRDNNNVAWRNITFLQGKLNKSTVSVGNPFKEPRSFSLLYTLFKNEKGELLNKYADVYLNMSSNLFELWQKSDFAGKGFKVVDKNKILLTEPTATIERLVLQPEELYLLEAEVNFFTQENPENNEFVFDIAEYVDDEKGGKELIGGETYIAIRNSERDSYFKAKAVDDKTVLPAEPVSFRAEPISEDAVYTWFDQKGDTVARGLNLTVTPTSTQHYKLEVVATADGFKDYDSVRATVRNGAIVSLSPNPTDNQLTITYRLAAGITNATIEISDVQNLSVQSYPVAATATTKTVSLAGLTAGTYVVKLIINGETVDTQQVIKN